MTEEILNATTLEPTEEERPAVPEEETVPDSSLADPLADGGSDGDGERAEEAEASSSDELDTLRAEVASLKAQLTEERAIYSRINAECAEFAELYPNVPLSSLSDGIWDSVKRGVPIAAAYALSERRAAVADMKANAVNSANRQLSSGSIDPHQSEEYYSPEEVKSMTPAQVRANYSKIISSMQKWH